MARQIKTEDAIALLAKTFEVAADDYRDNLAIALPAEVIAASDRLFISETQAYREALVGCAIARVIDQRIDIRLPATKHGEDSFSGRSLADKVVAPFLRSKAIPISASPYLSALRGGAKFIEGGAPRIQRDEEGFSALVKLVDHLCEQDAAGAKDYLRYVLRCFIHLRDSGAIALKRIAKPNLEQLANLTRELLKVKSGGRVPLFLATALFQTLSECHNLGWTIQFQGINVADKASNAVGDITIRKSGAIILGVEVTERPVEQGRVTLVFDQKVSASGLNDYLFITTTAPEQSAITAARSYTAVGHEMNFVTLEGWLIHNLATIGPSCRALYQSKVIDLLSAQGVPAEIKVAWNERMDKAIGIKPTD